MAWGDLAINQMVSYADAQTSGFSLNPGQTNPGTLQCMTKNDAFTKYNLSTNSNTDALASNQLMQKSFWQGPSVSYSYFLGINWDGSGYDYSDYSNGNCVSNNSYSMYYGPSPTPYVGMTVYKYSNLTVPIDWAFVYYKQDSSQLLTINSQGVITAISACVVSVVFSSLYEYIGSSSASYSGTVTISGAPATFNARSTSTGNFSTDTNININGNARRARQTTTGTLDSTTFTLNTGVYNYTFSCQVTGGGTGIGQIIFTQ
jgi:hypothetical protein